MLKSLPNILTIFRIFLVPIFPVAFFANSPRAYHYAFAIFLIAGITDVLDGTIARRYNLISSFGTAMDPLADKLMLLVALISLGIKNLLPLWLVIFMCIKESLMIIGGLYLYFKKEKYAVPANIFGKIATLIFSIAVMSILFAPQNRNLIYLVFFALTLKLIAFISYVIHHYKNRKNI